MLQTLLLLDPATNVGVPAIESGWDKVVAMLQPVPSAVVREYPAVVQLVLARPAEEVEVLGL